MRVSPPHNGGGEGAIIDSRPQPGRVGHTERITEDFTLVILRETHSAQAQIIGRQLLFEGRSHANGR